MLDLLKKCHIHHNFNVCFGKMQTDLLYGFFEKICRISWKLWNFYIFLRRIRKGVAHLGWVVRKNSHSNAVLRVLKVEPMAFQ